MTRTIATGPAMKITAIACLDEHGQDCNYCSTEGAVVEAQIYYTIEEPHEAVFETGCFSCMCDRAAEAALLGGYDFVMEVESE